jgi:two-component system, cell cycle response regulator DivK
MAGELILIVEDNDKNRKLVRDVLTFKGYTTIEAETGEAGVRLAQERRPNLVLMDIRLPGIDGMEGASAAPRGADHSGDSRDGHDRVGDE